MFDASVWNSADTAAVFLRFIANLRSKISRDVKEPSTTHRFIKLLRDQRRLVRAYTQNIDGLEQRVGLRTDLNDGRGSRSRFTRKSLALPPSPTSSMPGGALHGGCETVQLHGDLDLLRCSVCQKLVEWDECSQSDTLLEGLAPECPLCLEQDEVRRLAGRRSTRVGVLRPNVVLYGEEHPSADAIGPLVMSDIACRPDLLLIFGTSLKVHGLQKIVREFANVVHSRKNGYGRVIFINNTPPAASIWKGVIDTWVNLDCDKFVSQIRSARPDIWTRQIQLPFPVAKVGAEVAKDSTKHQLHDKENVAIPDLTTRDPKAADDHPSKQNTPRIVQPSEPFKSLKKRHALSDITTEAPRSNLPAPLSELKRKLSSGFEIYEDEPIVVSSSPSWVMKSVLVPSSPGSCDSVPPPKRRKVAR
jgi:NAD-dependent SIR2 family protein deacetylase